MDFSGEGHMILIDWIDCFGNYLVSMSAAGTNVVYVEVEMDV